MSIYVEIFIQGDAAELWRLTQNPELHVRWDLRFTDIRYLPRPDTEQPQRFIYETGIGFGLAIRGTGETVGQRDLANGERTSALKFGTDDPRSLIREGAGYWRYIPHDNGVRFITSYDYRVRFGAAGRVADACVFRPIMAWATAWSFDRLRLWIERGIDPTVSLQQSLIHLVARITLSFVWWYQGLTPKLLTRHPDEVVMLQQAGISDSAVPLALMAIGWSEVLLGVAMLVLFQHRWLFHLTILLMIFATVGVAMNSSQFLTAAFNPVSLNVLMAGMAVVGLLTSRDLPSAGRCLRKPPEEKR